MREQKTRITRNRHQQHEDRVAEYKDSLQLAKTQFPDYDFPITVELDVSFKDPKRVHHKNLFTRFRKKFQPSDSFLAEKTQELENTTRRLVARDKVFDN